MNMDRFRLGALGLALFAMVALGACGATSLGRHFDDPTQLVKVGYDREEDVVAKMGRPYRRTLDTRGRVLLTYIWADGSGGGETCIVALNEVGIVSLVDVAR